MTKHELLRTWGHNHMIPLDRIIQDMPLLEMLSTDEAHPDDDETDEVRAYASDIFDDPRNYPGVIR